MTAEAEVASVTELPTASEIKKTTRIESHEEAEAKVLISDLLAELGVSDPPTPTGWFLLVKVYVRPEMNESNTIFIPESVRDHDRFQSVTGLVLSMGPEAYKGDRFPSGAWCKPGDWVIIPRNEGFPIVFRKYPMQIIPDDKIVAVITDPTDVTAMSSSPRV